MNMKQSQDHSPVPQKWIKIFLGINLFVLCSFLIWELGGPALKSDKEMNITREQDDAIVKKFLDKNPEPKDLTGTLGPELHYTINATIQDKWAHFSFSKGTVFYKEKIDKDSLDWDIAFRRAKIVTNGGATNPKGKAEVGSIKTGGLLSVKSASNIKFQPDFTTQNIVESKNPVLDKWYKYDFWTHRLTPKNEVYVARTAKGNYVKFQIVDYYCRHVAGCFTLKYVYQGTGSDSFSG